MSYEIYRNRHSSDSDFHLMSDIYERVMREDKVLCAAAQANLDRGVFVNGQLHPRYEKAPLFFQDALRRTVTGHWEREKREGREVWPTRQTMRENSAVSERDEEVCRGVEYAGGVAGGKEALAW